MKNCDNPNTSSFAFVTGQKQLFNFFHGLFNMKFTQLSHMSQRLAHLDTPHRSQCAANGRGGVVCGASPATRHRQATAQRWLHLLHAL
jgi:hypothetical protein